MTVTILTGVDLITWIKNRLPVDANDQLALAFAIGMTACIGLVTQLSGLVRYTVPFLPDVDVYAEWLLAMAVAGIVACVAMCIIVMFDFYKEWPEHESIDIQ